MMLLAVLSLLIWFAHDAVDDALADEISKDISLALVALHAHIIAIVACVMMVIFRQRHPIGLPTTQKMLEAIASLSTLNEYDMNVFVNRMSEWDRFFLIQSTTSIRVEFLGESSGKKRASARESNINTFSLSSPQASQELQLDDKPRVTDLEVEVAKPQENLLFDVEMPADYHIPPQCSRMKFGITTPRNP